MKALEMLRRAAQDAVAILEHHGWSQVEGAERLDIRRPLFNQIICCGVKSDGEISPALLPDDAHPAIAAACQRITTYRVFLDNNLDTVSQLDVDPCSLDSDCAFLHEATVKALRARREELNARPADAEAFVTAFAFWIPFWTSVAVRTHVDYHVRNLCNVLLSIASASDKPGAQQVSTVLVRRNVRRVARLERRALRRPTEEDVDRNRLSYAVGMTGYVLVFNGIVLRDLKIITRGMRRLLDQIGVVVRPREGVDWTNNKNVMTALEALLGNQSLFPGAEPVIRQWVRRATRRMTSSDSARFAQNKADLITAGKIPNLVAAWAEDGDGDRGASSRGSALKCLLPLLAPWIALLTAAADAPQSSRVPAPPSRVIAQVDGVEMTTSVAGVDGVEMAKAIPTL